MMTGSSNKFVSDRDHILRIKMWEDLGSTNENRSINNKKIQNSTKFKHASTVQSLTSRCLNTASNIAISAINTRRMFDSNFEE